MPKIMPHRLSFWLFLAFFACLSAGHGADKPLHLYVGTRGNDHKAGGYHCTFDPTTGRLSKPIRLLPEDASTIVKLHPTGRYLLTAGSVAHMGKARAKGVVRSFELTMPNQTKPLGEIFLPVGALCDLDVDHTGRYLATASFTGGTVATFRIAQDGRLENIISLIKHPLANRTVRGKSGASPKAHAIRFTPDNRAAIAADLGLNQVILYRFDADTGKLDPLGAPLHIPNPGGPRHLAFHPKKHVAYVVNQAGGNVVVFDYDTQKGGMAIQQSISTLPSGYTQNNHCADLRIHPNGRFLYASNRGHDSIAMFGVDPATGKLTSLGQVPSGGQSPWSFVITPNGQHMLVTNRKSNNLVVFDLDPDTGNLAATSNQVSIPAPIRIDRR